MLRHRKTSNDRWKGADRAQAGKSNVNKPTIINRTSIFYDLTTDVKDKETLNITEWTHMKLGLRNYGLNSNHAYFVHKLNHDYLS